MHKFSLLIGGALLSHTLVFTAFAQEPGAGTPQAAPYKKASPEDKAAAKASRRAEGRAAALEGSSTGEGTPMPKPRPSIAKAEREQGRAARKAETLRAAKAGELKATGEVGPQK